MRRTRQRKCRCGASAKNGNALKHGLATKLADRHHDACAVEELARTIADSTDPARLFVARLAADAEIDLRRIRRAQTEAINSSVSAGDAIRMLGTIDRYYSRAAARKRKALSLL